MEEQRGHLQGGAEGAQEGAPAASQEDGQGGQGGAKPEEGGNLIINYLPHELNDDHLRVSWPYPGQVRSRWRGVEIDD